MGFKSTRQVAKLLGIKTGTLERAVWDLRVKPPEKGPSGAYCWFESDIERAAKYFNRQYEPQIAACA